MNLVTTAQARIHLRADTADDPWLEMFIPAISEAVMLWLKDDWRAYVPEYGTDGKPLLDSAGDEIPFIDSSGEPTPKSVVQAAVLIELASQYRFREGEGTDNVVPQEAGHGYILNKTSTAILTGLRMSTVA